MRYFRTPSIVSKLFSGLNWEFADCEDSLFLTFDDGPTPEITEWVLETLDKYNAKATFFCLGRNVERHPKIYNKIIKAGHSVGNHTFSHLKGWLYGPLEYIKDVELASSFIKSNLFRPPYGRIRPVQAELLQPNYKIIMWNVLTGDYDKNQSPEECLENTIKMIKPGSIIVFHDSVKAERNLRYVLPKVLEHYNEKLNFKAISMDF
ncbi:MAG: polysaccharide deacetylase family protein [Bacteroidales bacterium]|nr:polysaccharide deacetylase family protein [Bacteroidales bacterium]